MTTTPALQDSFKRMRSFSLGDSAEPGQKARYTEFFARLDTFARLDEPWTLVIKCVTGTCLEWKLSTSDNFHFGGSRLDHPLEAMWSAMFQLWWHSYVLCNRLRADCTLLGLSWTSGPLSAWTLTAL